MRPTASTWSTSRTPVWGYVWANNPTAGSYTPSTTYQRNLTRTLATNTITRSGVGYYKVVFENLGIYYGGTVDVTAYGPGPGECKVQNWGPTLADMNVYVRCFNANGAALDTIFTAALTRPISSSRFGYVWANSPSSASYTPSTTYQYNSTFATNTITRLGAGTYRVRLPGLGGVSGHVQMTTYGAGSERCKVQGWTSTLTAKNVNVRCFNAAGAPANSRYVVDFVH